MNACGRIRPLATRIPVNVPPATTVASSPRRAFSAIASSRLAGECHSGSSTGQLLLEISHGLGQHLGGDLPGRWMLDSAGGGGEAFPRLLDGDAAFEHPPCARACHRLEEAQGVGGLHDISLVPTAALVDEDQADHRPDFVLGQTRVSQEIANEYR